MKQLEITGQAGKSKILVGERLDHLHWYLPEGARLVIITDETVAQLYGNRMPATERIVISTGEGVKTLETASFIYRSLIEMEADRSVFLLGVGGGIVCDITGFVAATYLRGVGFANVPTTLLAQVDASVGGKTGVNFDGYKNMVGVFNQPGFVLCDPEMLHTLSGAAIADGFAEIVKHAAIADPAYFELLEARADEALARDPALLERIVYESVVIKADIVNRDEREQDERRKLNFGHTLGHAIEKTAKLSHGTAVSIGMAAAARLSVKKGYMPASEAGRLEDLLVRLGLPVSMPADCEAVVDALARDKKRRNDAIHFVLLEGIGKSIVVPIALAELKDLLTKL
ncbi:MAG: 3-dehydroquinate synthase [Desulfosalsimonas sp.]